MSCSLCARPEASRSHESAKELQKMVCNASRPQSRGITRKIQEANVERVWHVGTLKALAATRGGIRRLLGSRSRKSEIGVSKFSLARGSLTSEAERTPVVRVDVQCLASLILFLSCCFLLHSNALIPRSVSTSASRILHLWYFVQSCVINSFAR
jgi:hypothetical protein